MVSLNIFHRHIILIVLAGIYLLPGGGVCHAATKKDREAFWQFYGINQTITINFEMLLVSRKPAEGSDAPSSRTRISAISIYVNNGMHNYHLY